jgi:lipoate-protein ligase A
MDTWRLIPLETHNGFMNMAIDEAILTSRIQNLVPNTIRFYQWKPSAVTIGKNQNPNEQVYLGALREHGVGLVRRTSGGGTVYHDKTGEITYSVTAQTGDLGQDVTSVYTSVYAAVNDALRLIGIAADYSQGNPKNCPTLTVAGKKISGSAQTLRHGVVQQHGTLLLSVDLPLMFKLLRVPFTDDCDLAAQIAQRKITSVQNELHHAVSAETVQNALAQGFKAILKVNLENGALTQFEQALANKFYKEKFSTPGWNDTSTIISSQGAT